MALRYQAEATNLVGITYRINIYDADYGGAPGPMWLEHAWLSFPSIEDGSARTFWDPQDPGREPVEASLFAGLSVDTH